MAGILPTAPHEPKTKMSDYAWLVYGDPGIGKTTLGAHFPNPLFLGTEPGTAAMRVADVEIGSWQDFTAYVAAIKAEDHPYRTIVVDTVDVLFQLCLKHVCDSMGYDDPADGEYGKGWRAVKLAWTNAVAELRSLRNSQGQKLCILFLSHQRTQPITVKRGKKEVETGRNYISSALPGTARSLLHGHVDFILYAHLDEDGQRKLRTQPTDDPTGRVEAKGRGEGSRQLPDVLPLDFRALAAAFSAAFTPNKE